ncbi:MAG TPA: hypothetical protein VK324_17950 [Tepidisphaeraceae bacterium]|nr:hypothetical protein [Tepidisphaeraceae bacterium]
MADEFTGKPQAEVAWVKGLILVKAGRYNEAIPFLGAAAKVSDYHHAKEALEFLLFAQYRAVRPADAEPYYAELRHRFPTSAWLPQVTRERAIATQLAKARHGVAVRL